MKQGTWPSSAAVRSSCTKSLRHISPQRGFKEEYIIKSALFRIIFARFSIESCMYIQFMDWTRSASIVQCELSDDEFLTLLFNFFCSAFFDKRFDRLRHIHIWMIETRSATFAKQVSVQAGWAHSTPRFTCCARCVLQLSWNSRGCGCECLVGKKSLRKGLASIVRVRRYLRASTAWLHGLMTWYCVKRNMKNYHV